MPFITVTATSHATWQCASIEPGIVDLDVVLLPMLIGRDDRGRSSLLSDRSMMGEFGFTDRFIYWRKTGREIAHIARRAALRANMKIRVRKPPIKTGRLYVPVRDHWKYMGRLRRQNPHPLPQEAALPGKSERPSTEVEP
jgi:hypothetical protein